MPQVAGALGLDLGDAFREAPHSDIPTLVLTGTLDGRTYPREQAAEVAGLVNAQTVTVKNAGHNLFMVSPEITDVILQLMRGDHVTTRLVTAPMPPYEPKNYSEATRRVTDHPQVINRSLCEPPDCSR